MANEFQQDTFNAINSGFNFGQRVKGVQDQRRINELASQGYSAPEDQRQGLLGQIAQVDARAAQQQEQAFANTDERRNTTLANMARILTTAPEQARPGLYQRMLPTLSQFGMSELPQEYNAQTAPIIDQAANSIASAYGGGGAGVQSTYINRAGERIAVMRDGSQQVLGQADSRTQLRDQAGVAPSIVDLRTAQATPLQAGPIQQQGANGAYTIDPSLPPEVQAQIRAAESAGTEFNGVVAARPDSSQIITPYQQAQLARQDRSDARADMTAMAAQDARSQAAEARQIAAQQKAQQAQQAINTRQAQLADVQRGVQRVEAALNALDQSRVGTGPIARTAQQYLPAGQELETAVNAMNNSMLALTRVPGMGAQSDLEARIAGMRFPQLDREEGVNRRTLQDLKSFVSGLSRTAQQADASDRNALQTTQRVVEGPRSSATVRRARNPQTGQTLILVNGQWVPE